MVKIRALNDSGSSDVDENTCDTSQRQFRSETQEENLQDLYTQYLACIQNGEPDQAKQILFRLYELIRELDLEQASPVQRKLQFLTFRNLGDLFPDRIDFYVSALTLDERDVILWIKTAKRAFHSCSDYVLSRNCLQRALKLSPRNWVALDLLLDCLYVLGDHGECIQKCLYTLTLDDSYFKAIALAHHISSTCSYLKLQHESVLNKYLDESLLKREAEQFGRIMSQLNKLKSERLKCLNNDSDIEMEVDSEHQSKSPKKAELNTQRWEVSGVSMAQVGEQLIRLYATMRYDPSILQKFIDIVWNRPIQSNDSLITSKSPQVVTLDETKKLNAEDISSQEKESSGDNSADREAIKNISEEPKEGSQSSKSNNHSRLKEDAFPFEFVDKRRSSRVQKNQSKSQEEQDKEVFDKVSEIFNACRCFVDSTFKQLTNVSNHTSNSQTNSQDSSQESQETVNLMIVEQFFDKLANQPEKPRLLQMLSTYMEVVCFNLDKSQAPLVFRDIYRVYRHHKSALEVDCVKWNVNYSESEFWSMLCSLELHHNRIDWFFLWELLSMPGTKLTSSQNLSAKIRLVFVKGVYETRIHYLETALELFNSNDRLKVSTATHLKFTPNVIKGQIDAQTVHNLHHYLENRQFDKLFELISPDMQLTDKEIDVICQAFTVAEEFERGVKFFVQHKNSKFTEFQLRTLLTCLQNSSNPSVPLRTIRKLIHQCKEQSTNSATIATLLWTILLTILMANHDHVADAHIVKFIELAHEHLGSIDKCLESEGQFLLVCLDFLLNCCGEMEDELVLQCFHCLFGYTRRGYSFVSHCNQHLKMSWNSAEYVYSYFTPEQLPEFDTLSKHASINAEVKDLLKEIVGLMPPEMHPNQLMPQLNEYLNDGVPFAPDRSVWQQNADKRALIMKNIFYFLADYYFKNKEFTEAIFYYKLDLCLNPNRFDSWAATALSMTNLIDEQILNDAIDYYRPKALFDDSARTIRFFSSALALDKQNTKIWIEFGTFVYNIASYASKVKKAYQSIGGYLKQQKISCQMTMDELEEKRNEMLKFTQYCFESSLHTHADEEMWLHYYLLGKVHEKFDVLKALDYYDLADKHLYLSGASYPKRISYSPQSLSLEALEVHYRIHAAVLKCILRENKISVRRLSRMKMHLLNALRSPFARGVSKDDKSAGNMLNSFGERFELHHLSQLDNHTIEELVRRTPQDVLCVVDDVVNVTCDRVSGKPNDIKITLVNLCLIAFKRCLSRFNNHYKSLYRLAHYFYNAGNSDMAKNVFMNCFEYNDLVTGNKCTISGLFYERKPSNFFNGIWR
jgi:hypothetical protein